MNFTNLNDYSVEQIKLQCISLIIIYSLKFSETKSIEPHPLDCLKDKIDLYVRQFPVLLLETCLCSHSKD